MSDNNELAEVHTEPETVDQGDDTTTTQSEPGDDNQAANDNDQAQTTEQSPTSDHSHRTDTLKLPDEARDALREHLTNCTPEMADAAIDIATRVAAAMPKPAPLKTPIEHLVPGTGTKRENPKTSWATAFKI
ncbi:hypothetical protein [Corynebacterium pseudodiphtheriticum]|uniref:hypothetical protein n=1 Tax=Corynebacterium pseudodiphtheriticum TaxID=37637 RepID=UPI003B637D2D